MKVLSLQILCLVASSFSAPTCDQIDNLTQIILDETRSQPSLLPKLVRLGFHDCVGGCNGCINFNNVDNKGLEQAVDTLTKLYTDNLVKNINVSMADFFALAATVAVSEAVRDSNKARDPNLSCTPLSCDGKCPVPSFALYWGRSDVADCTTSEPDFPSPRMTGDQMLDYFQKHFGFDRAQVVALMGAHSLGGAHLSNSGYQGKWSDPQNVGFNELYYRNMINPRNKWINVNVANKTSPYKWQFNGSLADGETAGFRLNTDFELVYDLTLDPNTAQATCLFNSGCGLSSVSPCTPPCQLALTFIQIQRYAENCAIFITDFVDVFQRMLTNGYNLTDLHLTTCNGPTSSIV